VAEHELAHFVAGLTTFKSILSMEISAKNGGCVQFAGQSNWWIKIAPYWLPIIPSLAIAFILMAPKPLALAWLNLIGFCIAFQVHASAIETHSAQTDLQSVGFSFAWVFLPSAHLLIAVAVCSACLTSSKPAIQAGRDYAAFSKSVNQSLIRQSANPVRNFGQKYFSRSSY
jgi:hypothetical protein